MDLKELAHVSDSLGRGITREKDELVKYGVRNVEWMNDTTGWFRGSAATPQASPRSPWLSATAPVTRGRLFNKAKELSRNQTRSIDNAIANMEGKKLRQSRHDIEWHRKYILALSCMVLFFVGSSLGAVVGRGGLGLPTLLALCVFILFYVLSMLGEQMVKSGTLTPVSGMWLSTLLLTPLAVWLFWSTLRERSWMSRWGS
jgi:lipopolysaccharide export system permease protein